MITNGTGGPIVGFGQGLSDGVSQRYIVDVLCDPGASQRPQVVSGNFTTDCDVQDIDDVKVIVVGKETCQVTAPRQGPAVCAEPLGSITIVKDAVPDSTQTFEFTFNCDIPGIVCVAVLTQLDDDGDATNALSNTATFAGLDAGMYHLGEVLPLGWDLLDVPCSSNLGSEILLTSSIGPDGVTTLGITVNLIQGDHVNCTVVQSSD